MRICAWCGIRLRWFQLRYCRECRQAINFEPCPPRGFMSRFEPEQETS